MNSIRRPRTRPRRRSCNFKTFFWLLTHEAAWRILHPSEWRTSSMTREKFCHARTDYVRMLAALTLKDKPARRVFP